MRDEGVEIPGVSQSKGFGAPSVPLGVPAMPPPMPGDLGDRDVRCLITGSGDTIAGNWLAEPDL